MAEINEDIKRAAHLPDFLILAASSTNSEKIGTYIGSVLFDCSLVNSIHATRFIGTIFAMADGYCFETPLNEVPQYHQKLLPCAVHHFRRNAIDIEIRVRLEYFAHDRTCYNLKSSVIKVKISVPFKLGLLLSSITVVWGLSGQASGNADMSGNSNLGNHILDQLKCMAPPNPTLAFYALSKSKIINLKKNRGVDSVSCFDIRGGLKIGRLKFDFICGYSEDQLDWELFPNFYRRGPGTSPGPSISLGTHASLEKLKEWWQSQGLDGKPVFTKETSHLDYMDQDISEIICSNTN